MNRIVLFMFAGRRVNMEVGLPYLYRILDDYPQAELHLWDLTRDPADQMYLRSLEGAQNSRVRVLGHLHGGHPIRCLYPNGQRRRRGGPPCHCIKHKPPYEQPYKNYAHPIREADPDTIYVKIDDDVLFLETDKFADLIAPLAEHPNRIISANVVNNAVCAKYTRGWTKTANDFSLGDPADPRNDKRWWALHEDPEFAVYEHKRFLNFHVSIPRPTYVRTRPGEAVSINCVAFTHAMMVRLAQMMGDPDKGGLGDEGAVDRLLPWICLSFKAAHLSFGPQERSKSVDWEALRTEYLHLRKGYLNE